LAREGEVSLAERFSLPAEYRATEDALRRLRGVTSAHIVLDVNGQIAEIHIIADGDRQPKQIVRDVETTVLATLHVKVDHRKISVAQIDPKGPIPTEDPVQQPKPFRPKIAAPQRAPEEPLMDNSGASPGRMATVAALAAALPRLRFMGMNLQVSGSGCQATVELSRGRVLSTGDSSGPGPGKGALRSLAEATLGAVMHCYQDGPAFVLEEIAFTSLGQKEIVLVSVSFQRGREVIQLLGSTFVGVDPQQAVILATLDAINRFSGRLKERGFIEYEVGPSPVRS
jgi:hypothetical protein